MASNTDLSSIPCARLRRGFVIVLAAAALYSQAPAPAQARGIRRTVPPPTVRPPVVRPPRTGIEGARENRREEKDKKIKEDLEKEITDIEKEFLESKDGKDAKKKIDELKKLRAKELDAAEKEWQKKQKAKMANKGDDYACCVYTPQELINADDDLVNDTSDAHKKFDKAKEKVVGDGLKKSNPKKGKEYVKAQADLKEAKKAEPKVSKIGTFGEPPDPVKPKGSGGPGPVGGPVKP